MSFRNYLIVISNIAGSIILGAESFSFQYHINTPPEIFDKYYFHPEANSQYFLDSTIIDIFEWKVASTNPDLIKINIIDEKWVKLNDFKSTIQFQENEFKSSPIMIRGCPIVKIQLIPWKNGENGELEYLKEVSVLISIEKDPGLSEISYFPPDVINPQPIYRNYENFINTEYLIISTPQLLPAAYDLANLHQNEVEINSQLLTEVISTDLLISEGEPLIPELLNEYLIDRIENDEYADLKYILLLGDENGIPPYYYNNTPTDDYFTSNTVSLMNPQIPTGRIPVANLTDAESIVNQVREYIINPIAGDWKSKILLLADDQNHPDDEEFRHATNSDSLYKRLKNDLNFINLYGTDYVPTPSGGWYEHPELTNDLLYAINSGIALMNYIGHGSPTALAHENILNMSRDINSIQAVNQAIWIVGTCSFGHYDDTESMAEALLEKSDGSIGLITTTRAVGESVNIQYLKRVFDIITGIVNNDDVYNNYRLGDLAHYSKYSNSDYLFQVFGDPALPLPFPQITSIINTEASSDTFIVAEQAEIALNDFLDDYYMTVRGPEQYNSIGYYLPGEIIFQGNIQNSASFYIPLDISQCDTCTAKVTVFSESLNDDFFTGRIDNYYPIPIQGSETTSSDNTGPEIYLWNNDNLIIETGMVSPPFNLTIGITDPSGINLTGSMGHSIRYEINGIEKILNQDFNYVSEDSGIVTIILPDNDDSPFSFYVEAWDNVNNSTIQNYSLIMGKHTGFSVEKIYNYPNPFTDDTFFTFLASENADITIMVYTIGGSKVIEKKANIDGAVLSSIYWDGRDKYSNPIANGTYFYHLSAESDDGKEYQYISKLSKIK